LTYWRRRLAGSQSPNRIFDAVKAVVAETGALIGKTRRALDSTILDDAVATQDTVIQLIAAIRRVRRDVPGAAGVIAEQCIAHDYDDPGKPAIGWNDAAAREQLIDALVGDAHRLLGHLPERELGPKGAEAVALLALIAGQDVEPVEGSDGTDGRWQIAQNVAKDRVISVIDPNARHAHKTVHRRQDGFKAHIAIEPDTGIITDCELTKAGGEHTSDAQVGPGLLDGEPAPVQALADSAYGSGDARKELADAGHQAVIKPKPLQAAVPGGFTLDDFIINDDETTVTCPNGVTRPITARRAVVFGAACKGCPLRAQCTASKTGRTMKIHQYQALLGSGQGAAAGCRFCVLGEVDDRRRRRIRCAGVAAQRLGGFAGGRAGWDPPFGAVRGGGGERG